MKCPKEMNTNTIKYAGFRRTVPVSSSRFAPGYPFILLLIVPLFSKADGFKFRIKNTNKTNVAVFYRINEKSGKFKIKALMKLNPGEEKIKDVSLSKGDTICFYGQDAEEQTSVIIKRNFAVLKKNQDNTF